MLSKRLLNFESFEVMDILEEYCNNNNACLVMVTHDEEIAKKCDTLYKLQDYGLRTIIK